MSGTLDMGNNLITNLKQPAADQNAATKKYVDDSIATVETDISGIESTYLKLSGGTMSGDITMGTDAKVVFGEGHIIGGNNTLLFESFQSLDADGAKIEMVGSPTDLMDAANKNYVDSQTALVKSDIGTDLTKYLPKAGGIMSGSIDMGGKRILNVGTPSINNDAATKGYVDNAIADITPVDKYLPLSGGRLSGNLLMGTGAQIDFEEGAHIAYATDFGFGVQTNGGSVGIVSNNIIHTDTPIAADSKLITYSISDVSVVPGTTVKQYNCDGTGFQQMRFSGFQNVKFNSSLLVDEDPSEAMQVATKQYVDRHAGGGEVITLNDYYFIIKNKINDSINLITLYSTNQFNIPIYRNGTYYWFVTNTLIDISSAVSVTTNRNYPISTEVSYDQNVGLTNIINVQGNLLANGMFRIVIGGVQYSSTQTIQTVTIPSGQILLQFVDIAV